MAVIIIIIIIIVIQFCWKLVFIFHDDVIWITMEFTRLKHRSRG